MTRYRRRRLKIVQFVSQHAFWPLLSGRNFNASAVISVVKAAVFVIGVLVVPTLIFNIPKNGVKSNVYRNVLRNEDYQATSMDQPRLLSRIRRSSLNESAEDGYVPRVRNSRSPERQTIIVVSSNKIADDDFELDINESEVNQSPTTRGELDDNNHEGLLSPAESNADMDIIYANTLEICESRLISNQT